MNWKFYRIKKVVLFLLFMCLGASPSFLFGGQPATVHFDLNNCESYTHNGTNMDYSEFTAVTNNSADAILTVLGNTLYRSNPSQNRHSCTPGVNNTEGMCVSYDTDCNYRPGNERSVKFDIQVMATGSEPVVLSDLQFYEKAPLMFDWIDGPSGANNYPTFYGVRVLKDGVVIYEESGIATSNDWTLQSFDFSGNSDFIVDDVAIFNFELLAYCPIGTFAMQSVWDIDEVTVTASCPSTTSCVDSLGNAIAIDGGTVNLTTGGTVLNGCVGDIVFDVENTSTANLAGYYYIITDNNNSILAFVDAAVTNNLDLSGAPVGECRIWGWSQVGQSEPVPGEDISTLNDDDCEQISSNYITVFRAEPLGGVLMGGPFEFCVGDSIADNIPAGAITLSNNSGSNSQWVITDDQGNILGLPPMPSVVDFDGAGVGTCLVWHLSYEPGLTGVVVGNNAMTDLEGCYSLSNPISVNRVDCTGGIMGGTLEGGPFEFCVGDGEVDNVSGITLTGNTGMSNQWVITDDLGNILGLPPMPGVVDFDGAGPGTCLIWNLSYNGTLTGLDVGSNVSGLTGDYALSNSIAVVRNQPEGGTLEGGPFEFCVGDGVADNIDAGAITLSGNSGGNSQWVVTDDLGNILGLPPMPSAVDFDGAGVGTCLVWHLSYDGTLTGVAVGNNAMTDLEGCYSLSNPISVNRVDCTGGIDGGTLEGGPFEFCVGDSITDNVSGITLTGNTGMNNQWVITDDQGNILGLPPMPGVVDFDGAGPGLCLIWNLSYNGMITGLDVGSNVSGLTGDYALSNSISVTRNQPEGGTLEGGPFEFCVGDGVADNISAGSITLSGNSGAGSQWVVTDDLGNILGLPPMPSAVDFDGAGAGTCLIWHLSYDGTLTGVEVGNNAMTDLEGCYSLSNPIAVTRNQPEGGMLEGGPFEFCVGDGVVDNVSGVTLNGNSGGNSQWVVTDDQGNILGLPPTPDAVDFDGAGVGTCLIWHLSYADGLTGVEVGNNAMTDLVGCYSFSNPITVERVDCIGTLGGTLEGGPFEFCVGDGEVDNVSGITLMGSTGMNNQWVITDDQGNILGLPPMPGVVDFDGAGPGLCLIWNLSYNGTITGLDVGNNVSGLTGDYALSNSISVTRNQPEGGVLEGGPFEFCVGDSLSDNIPSGAISLVDNSGGSSQWVVTDDQGMILGLPPFPEAVDFEGAGVGTCLVWHLSYDGTLTGVEVGNNAMTDLEGCYSLSNPVTVNRIDCGSGLSGGLLEGGPFEFCVGDGIEDNVSGITLTGNSGPNNQWVITDDQGNILGLPPMPGAVNFDGAGNGVCLIWNIAYNTGLTGLEMGGSISGLVGDYDLSNSIAVVRNQPEGGSLYGGPFTFCVGDGQVDTLVTGSVTLTGNVGPNSQWVVTDDQGNILGLPPTLQAVDFDGAGVATCLIWHLSYANGLTGAEVGNNAMTDLEGCYSLSNPVTVNRIDCTMGINGGNLAGGPFEFCVGDGIADNVSGITLSNYSGANNQWVITDDQGNILGLPPMPGVVDFDGAGPGVCIIWNISYDGMLTGLDTGNNVSDITGDFALSNGITVTRNQPEGGMLSGGPFTFCVGDSIADNIGAGEITLTGYSGANSQWVVTDDQGNILGLPPTPEAVDFNGAGVGTCLIWHLSYADGLEGVMVGNNALTDLEGCYSLSNSITVFRTDCGNVSAGTVEGGPYAFCIGDGNVDNISDITLTGNTGVSNQWVVTDDQGNILGLPPTPDVVDFEAAGVGLCLIWNVSYDTPPTGLVAGNNFSDVEGMFAISNFVSVYREVPDGGTVSLLDGSTTYANCAGDIVFDVQHTTTAPNLSYWYIITDNNDNILAWVDSKDGNTLDLSIAPPGECHVWGWSYRGLSDPVVGEPISSLMDDSCESVSDNFITVYREVPDGGTVSLLDGSTTYANCAGDIVFDVQHTTTAPNLSYWYIITDNNDNILAWVNSKDGNTLDLSVAPPGECHVWGWNYRGLSDPVVGEPISSLMDDACESVSDNFITVYREVPDGGTVSLLDGSTEYTGIAGDIVFDVQHTTTAPNLSYWYIITDDSDNILAWVNSNDGNTLDLSVAPPGECHVWGWNYRGLSDPIVGESINTLTDDFCEDISDNFITVTRTENIVSTDSIVINEVTDGNRVELKNVGNTTIDVSSYWLCDFPAYAQLSNLTIDCGTDLVLEPGELVTVVANFSISGDDGEMGLYTSNAFGSSDALIDYVEWGSTGHTRSGVAVAAGIWTTGDFVPAFGAGMSIEYDGEGNSSADWSEDAPTPCLENTLISNVNEVTLSYKVFPNPAVDNLVIDFESVTSELGQLLIYDRLGNLMMKKSIDFTSQLRSDIDVSDLPSGTYFIKVISKSRWETQRFVKMN